MLLLPLCFCLSQADPIHYTFTQGGTKIGESTYEKKADGSFVSVAKIDVAGVKIDSTLSGQIKNGSLISYEFRQKGQGGDVYVKHANGKSSALVNGKEEPPRAVKFGKRFFSNYHPGVMDSIFKDLSPSLQGAQKVSVAILEGGGHEIELTVTPKSPRKIQRQGREETVRPFTVLMAGLAIDFVIREDGALVGESVASQRVAFVADGYDEVFADPVSKYKELSQPTHEVKVVRGVKVKMRDGVTLVHDVAMPTGEGKFPTILNRTPYGRTASMIGAEWWAKRGYIYIVQDCRGRHDSDGKWDPFMPERRDGKDTIDWIAAQPWSDGKVGMIGASYGGLVQWAAAVEKPAALKCLIPQVSPPDAMRNLPYDQGVFMLLPNLWWANLVSERVSQMERAVQPLPHPEKLLTLPLSKIDNAVLGRNVPFFDEWLKRDGMTKWKGFDFVPELKNVQIPALHISGWWDGDGIGTKTNWTALRNAGRKNQWLIYGPWPHAFNSSPKFADLDYGPGSVLELDSVYLRWFDTWLKGKSVEWDRTPKVQAFVTGANKWVNLSDWPEGTTEQKLYLGSKGTLLRAPAQVAAPATYTYDPRKVVLPDFKNRNMMEGGSTIVDLADTRKSGLIYKTSPMPQAMAIAGPISVDLHFSTNVVATDFFAVLVDISPKGVARLIGQPGKLDVRYLTGLDRPRLIQPGKPYRATLDLWDTAHEFKKGHQMALLITSEMFPIYARNLNTGEPIYSATKIKVAKQTIYQDAKRPSVLKFRIVKVR